MMRRIVIEIVVETEQPFKIIRQKLFNGLKYCFDYGDIKTIDIKDEGEVLSERTYNSYRNAVFNGETEGC